MHPFFEFFNREKLRNAGRGGASASDSASKIEYKEYPRCPQVRLPKPDFLDAKLADALRGRKSAREFSSAPISLAELSNLLYYSAGLKGESKDFGVGARRTYPSGGALYPIEIYCLISLAGEINTGTYHYSVKNHSLELLKKSELDEPRDFFYYDFANSAPLILFFSMIPDRTTSKYGEFGLKLWLIESGHIAQNMYLVSEALGLKCSAIGGFSDETKVHELLGLDGEREMAFYAMVFGH